MFKIISTGILCLSLTSCAGAIIGLLMAVAINLTMYAVSNIVDPTAGVVEVVVSAVRLGVAGAVIGIILGQTA